MPIPIYQYYAEDPWRFMYSPYPDIELGWTRQEVIFYGLAGEEGQPVYEYYAEKPYYRFRYSTDPNMELGWTKQGIAFYSFSKDQAGAIPIFEYSADDGERFFYASDPNIKLGWTNEYEAFYMLPANLVWTSKLVSQDFGDVKDPPTGKVDFTSNEELYNNSNSVLVHTIEESAEYKSSFEFGFKETIHIGTETELGIKNPFVDAKFKLKVDFTAEGHQTNKTEKTKTHKISKSITLREYSAVKVTTYIKIVEDLETPFTLVIRLSAKASGQDLDASQIKKILELEGFEGKPVKHSKTELDCPFSGTFKGSYGVKPVVYIEEIPLPEKVPD